MKRSTEDTVTTDALSHATSEVSKLIEEHLQNGLMDKNLVFAFYRGKTRRHIELTIKLAPPGGMFIELLQSVLDDREEWNDD